MFKKILVPLDGSLLAESVLPAAASLASLLNAAITLLHVIEENAPESVHQDRHLTKAEEAEKYLQEIAQRDFSGTSPVNWHVHAAGVKDVTASICSHAEEFGTDLIVMCTHGHSGVRDILFGSIAQQVVANGGKPVLLLRPTQPGVQPGFALRKMLLPLDSQSEHDQVIPYAISLAKAYDAELALLTVIPTFGTLTGERAVASSLLPGTTAALLDMEEQAAREHLQGHSDELKTRGLIISSAIARGDPAAEIVAAGARWNADLLILATHRKSGIDAFWARSVAPTIARNTRVPLLLLPLR